MSGHVETSACLESLEQVNWLVLMNWLGQDMATGQRETLSTHWPFDWQRCFGHSLRFWEAVRVIKVRVVIYAVNASFGFKILNRLNGKEYLAIEI